MKANAAPSPAELVLLHVGPWRIALPRREVRDLVAPNAIGTDAASPSGEPAAGLGPPEVPVVRLDDDLRTAGPMPVQRRICVVLDAADRVFGLTCDEFEHRIAAPEAEVTVHELPPAMRKHGSPTLAVLQVGRAVAAVTNAAALSAAFSAQLSRVGEPV